MNKYAQMADRLYDLNEQLERFEKENAELKEVHESDKRSLRLIAEKGAELELKIKKLTQHLEPQVMTALFEQVEEEVKQGQKIKELEKEISILLSCKNCPNNKGGYICQKEYEDKCLSQKIQYIKELQEENAELKEKVKWYSEKVCCKECAEVWGKAKEILKKYHDECPAKYSFEDIDDMAEQFLKECE